MLNFREFVLLQEVTQQSRLYHRSANPLEPGMIMEISDEILERKRKNISPQMIALDKAREKINPNAPSRMNSIYCSFVPRSAFMTRGDLYEVSPMGPVHITDAFLVNEINAHASGIESRIYDNSGLSRYEFSPEEKAKILQRNKEDMIEDLSYDWKFQGLCQEYWNPTPGLLNKLRAGKRLKWAEVLCEKVRIIRKVEDVSETLKNYFKQGDHVKLLKDIYVEYYSPYAADGKRRLSPEEASVIYKKFNGFEKHTYSTPITLPAGTTGVLNRVEYSEVPYYGHDEVTNRKPYRRVFFQPDGYDTMVDLLHITGGVPGMNNYRTKDRRGFEGWIEKI